MRKAGLGGIIPELQPRIAQIAKYNLKKSNVRTRNYRLCSRSRPKPACPQKNVAVPPASRQSVDDWPSAMILTGRAPDMSRRRGAVGA
jgi:hypothetical protein